MGSSNYRLQKLTLSFLECLGCGDSTSRIRWAGTEGRRPRPNSQAAWFRSPRTGPVLWRTGHVGVFGLASPAN